MVKINLATDRHCTAQPNLEFAVLGAIAVVDSYKSLVHGLGIVFLESSRMKCHSE